MCDIDDMPPPTALWTTTKQARRAPPTPAHPTYLRVLPRSSDLRRQPQGPPRCWRFGLALGSPGPWGASSSLPPRAFSFRLEAAGAGARWRLECAVAPALGPFHHMKVLRRKVALEIHRSKKLLWAYPGELINADSTSQRHKTIAG